MGTNGEASHLTASERILIISSARQALDAAGLQDVPLLVGTGGNSARETIQFSKEAKEAGADFSIVIHPGYFAFVMGKDNQAIYDFFIEVADGSALPVMCVFAPFFPAQVIQLTLSLLPTGSTTSLEPLPESTFRPTSSSSSLSTRTSTVSSSPALASERVTESLSTPSQPSTRSDTLRRSSSSLDSPTTARLPCSRDRMESSLEREFLEPTPYPSQNEPKY